MQNTHTHDEKKCFEYLWTMFRDQKVYISVYPKNKSIHPVNNEQIFPNKKFSSEIRSSWMNKQLRSLSAEEQKKKKTKN